jgi:hypothetical protein
LSKVFFNDAAASTLRVPVTFAPALDRGADDRGADDRGADDRGADDRGAVDSGAAAEDAAELVAPEPAAVVLDVEEHADNTNAPTAMAARTGVDFRRIRLTIVLSGFRR